jgi:hypothetical protein
MLGSGSAFVGEMEKRYKEFLIKKSEAESLRLRVELSISDAKGSGLLPGLGDLGPMLKKYHSKLLW